MDFYRDFIIIQILMTVIKHVNMYGDIEMVGLVRIRTLRPFWGPKPDAATALRYAESNTKLVGKPVRFELNGGLHPRRFSRTVHQYPRLCQAITTIASKQIKLTKPRTQYA